MSNTTIQLRHSTETGNVPVSLANGEIAINTQDGKLYYADPSGTIQEFSGFPGPSGLDTEIQFNDSGVLGANSRLTFNKTTGVLTVNGTVVANVFSDDGTNLLVFANNAYNHANAAFAVANTGGGGSTITIDTAPPTSGNSVGDMWVDSSSGITFTWLDDGDSYQWIELGPAGTTTSNSSLAVTSGNVTVSGNIIPSADITYDLGAAELRWRDLYLSGNTLNLGGATIKTDSTSGAIALIPATSNDNPSPKALVISPTGTITTANTDGGTIDADSIANAATNTEGALSNDFAQAAFNTANSAFETANNATDTYVRSHANSAYDHANAAFEQANTGGGGGGTSYDEASTSTGYFGLPVGTTAERPGTPAYGMIRFNSNIGTVEIYNSNAWERIGGVISVTGVSPNTFSGNSGTTFTLTGVGFTSGAIVSFITNSSQEYNAGTTTFLNSSQLQASTPRDFTVDDEPLSVKVTNPSGITGVKTAAIDCGGSPTFASASGTLGNIYNSSRSYTSHLDMTATDADGQGVTYSVTAGTIPAGLTFNNANGTFSGTASSVANDTTYSFTVTASDGINETSRAFSITVKAAVTETFTNPSSFTWTSPAGVTKIASLVMIGGGGGGNAGYQAYGWAGGGAGYVNATDITVDSATQYSFTVGAGGLGAIGTSGTTVAGSDGENTTAFNNTAFGGEGGQITRSGLGGGYTVSNGTDNGSASGTGGATSGNNGKAGGNNGGGSAYGTGAAATGNYTPGNSATGNGNGGGGGSSSQNWIGTRSGNGSGGLISITY